MTEVITQTDEINLWTPQKERKAIEWKEDFEMYRYLHGQVVASYNRLNQILSIPSILITAITSVGIFATLGIEDKTPVIIVAGILNIIALFLQGVNEFYDPKTLSHKHLNTVKEYSILFNDIDEQLTQEPVDRINGRDFIKKIRGRSNDLIMNGPTIPNRFWDNYFISMSKGEIINRLNRKMFFPDDKSQMTKDNNKKTRLKTNISNQDSSGETIIPMSFIDENNVDNEGFNQPSIHRSYSESSEGSKETFNQVARFIKNKGNKNTFTKQLAHHIGRI